LILNSSEYENGEKYFNYFITYIILIIIINK